jgi:hypothetical protein
VNELVRKKLKATPNPWCCFLKRSYKMKTKKTLIALVVAMGVVGFVGSASATETICLDNYCDTVLCGLDNSNVVTCKWNWTCSHTDDAPAIGAQHRGKLVFSADLVDIARLETWDVDLPLKKATIWIFDDVGQSSFLASDTFTLNSCTFAGPSNGKPSLMSTLPQ